MRDKGCSLNHRERFLGTFEFKDVNRVPDYEFGYWTETVDRWHREGLPIDKKTDRDIELYLGLEGLACVEMIPVRTGLWPNLPERIIREDEDKAIVDDGMGGIYVRTKSTSSVPHYIRHPLKNRDDREKLKPFFDPNTLGRFPPN